jgi:hypothetical protein
MKVTDEKLDGRVRKMLMFAGKEDWLQLYSLLSASTTSTASITESPFQLMIQIHLDGDFGYTDTSLQAAETLLAKAKSRSGKYLAVALSVTLYACFVVFQKSGQFVQ